MISTELRFKVKLSFFNLILREDFTAVCNFFNNNIFFVSDNFNSFLYFLKILTIVTAREDYEDIEIKLDITTLCQ